MSTQFPLPPAPIWPRVGFRDRPLTQGDEGLARLSEQAPRVPWDRFVRDELQWDTGEHVALVGPTGQGKTTLLLNLLPLHPFVAVFATKPKDDSMDRLIRTGYVKLPRWRNFRALDMPRRVIWPDATRLDSVTTQREVFHDAFDRIYREGGWTLALDEVAFLVEDLKLGADVKLYLRQGRSLGISLVTATQRPRYIPLEVYDQSTHLFFWRDNDADNLRRLAELNWTMAGFMREVIANLEQYQTLYVNTRTGRMLRTRAPGIPNETESQ